MNNKLIEYIDMFGPLYLPKGVDDDSEEIIDLMNKAIKRNSPIEPEEITAVLDGKFDIVR